MVNAPLPQRVFLVDLVHTMCRYPLGFDHRSEEHIALEISKEILAAKLLKRPLWLIFFFHIALCFCFTEQKGNKN